MTDPVVFVLRQHRQTLRALLEDMKLARKWGHSRELSGMARFLMRLLQDLPDLYKWAAKHVPSGIYNNPSMTFKDVIQRMDEMLKIYKSFIDLTLERRETASDVETSKLDEQMSRSSERLALSLRNLKAKAKKLGPWSEAHEERFGPWMRIR